MHSLPIFVRLEGRSVILLGEGTGADAKRRLLERAGARVTDDAQSDAALAVVVLDNDEAAARAVAALRARGILVNATDRPDLCDFTLPAIIDRDPVLIAVGTGGASAGLAKVIRQRIEALLPATLGRLAKALQAARAAMRTRWPGADDRRRALDAALMAGGPLDPLGTADEAAVGQWLGTMGGAAVPALVAVPLRGADPDDLTLRAARLLGQADRIYHTPDVPADILDRARADAQRIACAAPPAAPGDGLSLWLTMEGRA